MRPGWWLVLLLVLGISPAQAQAIDVQVRCAGPLQEGLPPNFEGTIYRVLTPFPYAGNGRWELEAITAQGSVLTDIPVPADLNLKISPVEISPDGRYVVFDPVQDGTALAVWDRLSNAMTSLELPSETTEYLNTGITPLWRHQLKIDWLSPNQFVIRYFDLENEIFLDLLAEQVFTVTTNPLAIDAGPKQEIEYPSLPFPRDENLNTVSFSPRHTYVQALFQDEFKPWLDFRFQIYDAVTLEQVADFNSNETFQLRSEPRWSYDESVLFLQYSNGDVPGRITEVSVAAGFQESRDFLDALIQTFGTTFTLDGLRTALSPSRSRFLMTITASDFTPYAVVYDYEARMLKAVCRGSSAAEASITRSQAYPIWGGDEDIVGYYDVGNLYLYDTVSGQSYYRDVFPYVGWLGSSESIATATPTANPIPTDTPTFTHTPTPTSTPTPSVTSTPAAFQRLRLTSMCSDNPSAYRRWRIRNSNPYDVFFNWGIYGSPTHQNAFGVAPPAVNGVASEIFILSGTESGANTVRIFVNGQQQDVKASSGAACN